MARWDEERGRWEGRERHGHEGGRGRDDRGGWRSEDTWRGGGWREAEERDDWEREERGEGRYEGLGRQPGGRAEWERLRDRERGWGRAGGRYGYGGRERLGREEWERGRGREYGGFMGGMAERYGHGEEGRGWEARSDFGRGSERELEYRGRSDWGRGGEERGPMERLGERMREGWRKMTGRGPKGYQRSDERIREDVSERIARTDLDASEVEVKVERAEVTLSGFVGSRWDKRMLEDIADDVFGVEEVHNHLRLRREAQPASTTAQAETTAPPRAQPGPTQPEAGSRGHH